MRAVRRLDVHQVLNSMGANLNGRSAGLERRWAMRLEEVGLAIDNHEGPLRDIAIVSTGRNILVTALVWTSGNYHGGWIVTTFVASGGRLTPVENLRTYQQ